MCSTGVYFNLTSTTVEEFTIVCDQFQVPESSPIKSVEDLAGKRIVTSYEVLAGKYFNELDAKLGLVNEQQTKVEYVGGSVEAACSLGLADGIGR